MLLEDIYECAETGGGALMAAFPGDFTQVECQSMLDYLKNNKLPVLLTAGIPETVQIAHKHGWVSDGNGVINTIGDAGIIYSPPEIMSWLSSSTTQTNWSGSRLPSWSRTSPRAVYNYYNIPEG